MRKLGAAAVLTAALLTATAQSASSRDHLVQPGTSIYVGTRLTCAVFEIKAELGISCLERNPKTNDVYRKSLGVTMIAGKSARVQIVYYDKEGNAYLVWHRNQPRYLRTGVFPQGKAGKDIFATRDDRFRIGGTAIFCPMFNANEILCSVVDRRTLKPVPGTYAIDATAKSVEVDRFTKARALVTVTGYDEPKLRG